MHMHTSRLIKVCVKRRAAISIMNAMNVTRETADEAVNSVYDVCFKDTEPFDRIP